MTNDMEFMRGNKLTPYRGLNSLQRTMNRLFDDFWEPLDLAPLSDMDKSWYSGMAVTVDMEETDSHIIYSLDIPGMDKKDIKIEVVDNNLIVSGERREERKSGQVQSRRHGRFQKVFALFHAVEPKLIEAAYENGVLRLAIPKKEDSKRLQIPITEGKPGIFQRLERIAEKVKGNSEKNVSS